MLVRKETYLKVGGFDEVNLPVAFNDVDFCLGLRQAGFLIVWTPHAELYHHESASRGLEDNLTKYRRFNTESDFMKAKWGDIVKEDPYYNPNLSLSDKFFRLAFPPRVQNPWQCS
jgi:GT2 family glycosyltransferase